MDQNQTNPLNSIPTNPLNSQMPPKDHKKVGPIVATLVVILIIIIGILYFIASKVNQQVIPTDNSAIATDNSNAPINAAPSAAPTVTPITNKADDLNSLNADIKASANGVDSQNL